MRSPGNQWGGSGGTSEEKVLRSLNHLAWEIEELRARQVLEKVRRGTGDRCSGSPALCDAPKFLNLQCGFVSQERY